MGRRRKPRVKRAPLPSGYRIMWTVVLFDLPVGTPENRQDYRLFRKSLLDQGFMMLQYSVYAICNLGEERAEVIAWRVQTALPPDGQVRIIQVTDRQFGQMRIFHGKKPSSPEEPVEQLELF